MRTYASYPVGRRPRTGARTGRDEGGSSPRLWRQLDRRVRPVLGDHLLRWQAAKAARESERPLPCQGAGAGRGDLQRRPGLACELGRWRPGGDRCYPLRSGRSWPGCGPEVAQRSRHRGS
jgi:hypothetical protein